MAVLEQLDGGWYIRKIMSGNSDMAAGTPMSKEQVAGLLRSRGITPTAQRVRVGQILFACDQHLSADEVLRQLRADGSRVSKATVYNTMNLFSERGLVRTVELDPERLYYDSTSEPHHHFYNVDTGELIDIPADSVQLSLDTELPPGTEQDGVEIVIRVRSHVH
jgi:Fur family iron response transcriptional regulator